MARLQGSCDARVASNPDVLRPADRQLTPPIIERQEIKVAGLSFVVEEKSNGLGA